MAVERMPTTALVPTQEDLIIDDTLSDLDRVVKYGTKSLALQRLVHTRMIGRVSKLEGCVKGERGVFTGPAGAGVFGGLHDILILFL